MVHFGTNRNSLRAYTGTAGDVDTSLTGGVAYHYNHVTVTGLAPNTTYYYTVEKSGVETEPVEYTTGSFSDLNLLYVGDPQIGASTGKPQGGEELVNDSGAANTAARNDGYGWNRTLEIAAELGLETYNAEGYIGWAQTGPIADGQKYLATITHNDVVPEGNGWDADPYTVRVRDGWILGRGVSDDKGPGILCLYALKYLKDSGVQLKYPVRALMGTNEETHMHDVDYYAAHYPMPAFCFTPDAEFPVCNGEKGGFNGEIVSPKLADGQIVDFQGGVAHNAVPDRAFCTVRRGPDQIELTRRHEGTGRKRHHGAARPGQERPRGHARGHGERHRPAGGLPAA